MNIVFSVGGPETGQDAVYECACFRPRNGNTGIDALSKTAAGCKFQHQSNHVGVVVKIFKKLDDISMLYF